MILKPNTDINNNKSPEHINSHISKETPNLSFATHNVKSLQCIIKNTSINDTFIDFNTDFVGLTETRHKSNQFYRYSHDPNFCAFWSSRINTYAGVGILVKRSWAVYIQRTFLDDDRFIYIDLYLAGHIKLRIFCIYLHASLTSETKKERLKLHKTIIKHIKDGLKSDFKINMLGDFKANLDNYWSHSNSGSPSHWRFDFYDQIFALNFLDLYDLCHDSPEPTFCANN
jgi:exonuclease III